MERLHFMSVVGIGKMNEMEKRNGTNLIYASTSFTVERHPQPFVSREEGGHIRIFPKDRNIRSINDLSLAQANELIQLEMVARESLIKGMNRSGVPVIWVNIEDLGNWAFKRGEQPVLHIHFFGRVKNAIKQVWPDAVYLPDRSTGFYDGFEPLNQQDMKLIREEIEKRIKNFCTLKAIC